MAPIFKKIKKVWKHPVAIIVMIVTVFIAYHQLNARAEAGALVGFHNSDRNSVTFNNGKYEVDSAVIQKDLNKKRLITDLETEKFSDRKTKAEIPDFIWTFLNSICSDKKFEIADPGEEWKIGITDFGHQIIKKVFDVNKQDSVLFLSGDGAILPNKQLAYCGIGKSTALLSYYSGGLYAGENVIVLKFKDNTITDFWYGGATITNKSEIIKSLKLPKKGGC